MTASIERLALRRRYASTSLPTSAATRLLTAAYVLALATIVAMFGGVV